MELKKKFIFFHIPKNGGTNIKFIINKLNNNNLTCFDNFKNLGNSIEQKNAIKKNIPSEYKIFSKYYNINEFECFIFIRNPYTRCISTFKWILAEFEDYDKSKEVPERRRKLPNGKILDRNISFNDFVELIPNILNSNIEKYNNLKWHLQPQYKQVYCENNKIIKNIFLLENYQEEIMKIKDTLKINDNNELFLQKKNSSNIENYQEYLTESIKTKIYKIYEEDFKLFNYKSNL
jgi:hypothetical protein